MAAPTVALTFRNLRRRLARRFDDNIDGTAAGGSTTTITDTGDIDRFPTTPQYLLGSEVTHINSTNTVQSRFVTTHAKSGGTVTLTVPTWTTPTAGDNYEIHNIAGRGFPRVSYEDAINAAIDSVVDGYWTDTDTVHFGMEGGGNQSQSIPKRVEYPVPGSLNYLYSLEYLRAAPTADNPIANAESLRSFGKTTGPTRLAQGFKVQQSGWYEWFMVAINAVGTNTDNLTLSIMGDSSGVADNSALTDGVSDTFAGSKVDERNRFIPFRMTPPLYLTQGTQYHWSLARSGSTSDTLYYRLPEDTGNSYGDGVAQTFTPSTYTAVSGSDFCFAIFPASTQWMNIGASHWSYRRVGTDGLYIPGDYYEGTPIRICGGTAIAEVSAETDTVPIRPEYVEAYAVRYLLGQRSAYRQAEDLQRASQWAEQVLRQPRPIRNLPPNAVKVFA